MSVRVEARHGLAVALFALLLAVVCFVPGCGRQPPGDYMMLAADDAPIRVKNQRLEVELMGKVPDDKWKKDSKGKFHPTKSVRKHTDLVIFGIKQDGTWCDNQPFRTDSVDIEYGDGTNIAETVTINVDATNKRFNVQFKTNDPDDGTRILYYQGASGDFLSHVTAKNSGGVFDCKADASNPLYVNIFEVK